MQGKIVLITGGAKRVGAAICRRLHAAGANLMLHYRASAGEARLLQAELNDVRADSVALIQADLLDLKKLPSMVEQTLQTLRPPRRARQQRVVVLSRRRSARSRRGLGRPDRHQPARAAVPRAGRGAGAAGRRRARSSTSPTSTPSARSRTTSSIRSRRPGSSALTRSLARELAPEVRVNAVAPGPILWPDDDVVRRAVAPADHLAHAAEARRHARRHREGRAFPARRRDLRHRRDDQRRRRTAHRDLAPEAPPAARPIVRVSPLARSTTAMSFDPSFVTTACAPPFAIAIQCGCLPTAIERSGAFVAGSKSRSSPGPWARRRKRGERRIMNSRPRTRPAVGGAPTARLMIVLPRRRRFHSRE